MTPDTSKARKLIEEARELVMHTKCHSELDHEHLVGTFQRLTEALTLLPSWQEFDPEREETWPKEEGWYSTTMKEVSATIPMWWQPKWNGEPVIGGWTIVIAFQPLPPPYRSAVKEMTCKKNVHKRTSRG